MLGGTLAWATTGKRPEGLAIDKTNGILYAAIKDLGAVQKIDISTKVTTTIVTGVGQPAGIVIDSNKRYLYVADMADGSNKIYRIDLADNSKIVFLSGGLLNKPFALAIDSTSTYLYVSNWTSTNILKIDISTSTVSVSVLKTYVDLPFGLTIDSTNTYMYVVLFSTRKIRRIALADSTDTEVVTLNTPYPKSIVIDPTNTYLYVTQYSGDGNTDGQISRVDIASLTASNFVPVSFGLQGPSGLAIDATGYNLYVNHITSLSLTSSIISQIVLKLPPPPYPCFKEGSKILTAIGYIPIQDLRKGDLVKTVKHDFKPIAMIGKREIIHHASEERIKDQLYECSPAEYPELLEPLVITGCHSILVDEFRNEEQQMKVLEVLGNIYVTDNKYRLPACADDRASVYEKEGTYTIYHLALENDDYYMNYGIYANGLLVETCSKRYLKELSNMQLID